MSISNYQKARDKLSFREEDDTEEEFIDEDLRKEFE